VIAIAFTNLFRILSPFGTSFLLYHTTICGFVQDFCGGCPIFFRKSNALGAFSAFADLLGRKK
jgi:hypothetical protein